MVKHISNPVASSLPVNRVEDPAVRQSLQRLSEGWSVRNGRTDERFITARELKNPEAGSGLIAQALGNLLQNGNPEGSVSKIVQGIESAIMQTKLWQKLGTQLQWISRENNLSLQKISALQVGFTEEQHIRQAGDTQILSTLSALKVQVDENSAAILEEQEVRASADEASATTLQTLDGRVGENTAMLQNFQTVQNNWNTATAQQLSTLQVSLGQNNAAIQTEANARAEADGKLEAQYTVKVDVNGYVSGYGLASTASNSNPYSQFIVRADLFAVGTPSGPGIAPCIPFIVTTTTDEAGNPPGVYIQNAMIKDLSVDTLKIKGEAITTEKLQDMAVTGSKLADVNIGVVQMRGMGGVTVKTGLPRRALVTARTAPYGLFGTVYTYPVESRVGEIHFPPFYGYPDGHNGDGGGGPSWYGGMVYYEWI